jgi:hypothetical protein
MAKGLRQAHGTIRKLKSGPTRLTNGRGRTIKVDGSSLRWLAVVVIDHPAVPSDVITVVDDQPNPSVVVLRRDWEFLFDQLKSTYAVTRYLERVAGEASELGKEPMRYFQLAQADENAPPGPFDPQLIGPDGRRIATPLLPVLPVASDDQPPHLLVRSLFEDIAVSGAAETAEVDRLRMLAALDHLQVGIRGQIGQFLIDAMEAAAQTPAGHTEWRQRRVVMGPSDSEPPLQLTFATCSRGHSVMVQDLFGSLVRLRHHDVYEVVDKADSLITVGVLLTPRIDAVRPWDTTMIATAGDPDLDADHLAAFRQAWSHESD